MFDLSRIRRDLMALGLLAFAVLLALSLLSYDSADPPSLTVFPPRANIANLCGTLGALMASRLRMLFGLGAYLVLYLVISQDVRLFFHRETGDRLSRPSGMLLVLPAFCAAIQLLSPGLQSGSVYGAGGYVGAMGSALLTPWFSMAGTAILIASLLAAGTILAGETRAVRLAATSLFLPLRLFDRLAFGRRLRPAEQSVPTAKDEDVAESGLIPVNAPPAVSISLAADDADEPETAARTAPESRKPIKVNPPVTGRSDREEVMARLDADSLQCPDTFCGLPDLDLLEEAEEFPYELLAKKARVAAITLEQTFQEFGLNVHVSEIDTGPVITQFELELEPGLRLSKVTALADDLAIALRVPAVRVVAPIPGKNTVGVEVPNEKQVMVRLRELIESCPEQIEKKRIPIFLGKDVSGRPLVVDLTKMPHLLIAGRTGTGKSVCLNTLILSMLMTRGPDEVKMLMIDPKMVELSPYRRIPHLMHPVITDMKKAEAVLAWAVDKMEERYDLLARCRVRHLDGFNQLDRETVLERLDIDPDSEEAAGIPDKMPYIVIVADEMADMMMTSGKDVEGHIIRLAQKSRAVGIHLVLATQKPTVDVITGLIKSNLPARISFQVASRTDSRVVLDEMGAERLLGNGDMLYLAPGTSSVTRAQGAFVGDDEINGIIDFFSDQEPQYSTELAQISAASSSSTRGETDDSRKQDDLYEQAIEVVIREGRGSVSLLQRALGIGYGRGARLIDYMAEDGIVGDYNGSQAREVLYSLDEWDAFKTDKQLEPAGV